MKRKSALPVIPAEALRDHGTDERIDRVWQRLESDLTTSPARPRAALWWAPAAVVIVFGSGVIVGARWGNVTPPPSTTVAAEPTEIGDERPSGQELPEPVAPVTEEREQDKRERVRQTPLLPLAPEPTAAELVETPPPLPTSPAPASTLAVPVWYRMVDETGDYRGARKAIEREGGFDVVIANATAEQLMVVADIARATGVSARALQAFRRVTEQFPGDANAPLAAFLLGKELEKAGDKAGAARAFALSRTLSPKGSLAEDALARQVEAAVEQGNVELARQLADEYAKDFPKGRRLGELRAQIAKLTGEPEQPAPAKGGAASSSEDEAPSEEPEEPAAPTDR